ncbi:hypothetical protein FRX31_012667 [Thalictrum thalictroides]|uniref:Uncharacterized protein n=1 Tax=Thalictrum thalictroides TaxID=46969 RepID=A0A7J6WK25_THATH|nr:hypothetical protein FRX31_012667 [Thalictrum thalictroides]
MFDRILGLRNDYDHLESLTRANYRGNYRIQAFGIDISGTEAPFFIPVASPKESQFRNRSKQDSCDPSKSSTSIGKGSSR